MEGTFSDMVHTRARCTFFSAPGGWNGLGSWLGAHFSAAQERGRGGLPDGATWAPK